MRIIFVYNPEGRRTTLNKVLNNGGLWGKIKKNLNQICCRLFGGDSFHAKKGVCLSPL